MRYAERAESTKVVSGGGTTQCVFRDTPSAGATRSCCCSEHRTHDARRRGLVADLDERWAIRQRAGRRPSDQPDHGDHALRGDDRRRRVPEHQRGRKLGRGECGPDQHHRPRAGDRPDHAERSFPVHLLRIRAIRAAIGLIAFMVPLCSMAPVYGDFLLPTGSEFQINTLTTGFQGDPSVSKATVKFVPAGIWSVTVIVAWWSAAIFLQRYKPSPVPWAVRVSSFPMR